MRIKGIIIVLVVLMSMTGCSNKINESEAFNISNKIVEYINGDFNTKGLSSREKQIFKDFIKSTKEDNYVINLDEIYTFEMSELDTLDSSNNGFVYEENGNYKIKYTNINWIPYEAGSYATINYNGQYRTLYKKYVPLLNEETKDNTEYLYVYDFTTTTDSGIEVYYKSVNLTGGLIVKFKTEKRNLKEIIVDFVPEYNYEISSNSNTKLRSILSVLIIILIVGVFVVIILFLLKRV